MRWMLVLLVLAAQDKPHADPATTTDHTVTIGGEKINYEATAGLMTLKGEGDKPQAKVFYVAYTKKDAGDLAKRPLMISFNGGPGSSSVWLHLGLLGPRRVEMKDDATVSAPPYALVENGASLLDKTDLLFIDPVGTGYSRPAEGVEGKAFFGVEEDIESVGKVIHQYVTRNHRWESPRYLIGESYGTTRAAALSAHLQDAFGMELNGVILISTVLDFNTISQSTDLSFQLYLPTYAATAWYHKKLAPDLQKDFGKTLKEAEEFAANEYAAALFKGSDLSDAERKRAAEKVARYTGLPATFVEQCNLRVSLGRFCKELRRGDRLTVGRLDTRYTGQDPDSAGDQYSYDASYAAIQGPYSECINKYVRGELGFESDQVYEVLTGKVRPWNYGPAGNNRYVDVSSRLRAAMAKNPHLKVFVACGYMDGATPYFAAQYTFRHMGLEPAQQKNVTFAYYEAGHMMYIHGPSLARLREDLVRFLTKN